MLRSQRIFLIIGLLLIAALLHFSTCDWVYRDKVSLTRREGMHPDHSLLLTWKHSDNTYTGVISELWLGYSESLALGMGVPLLLLLVAGYLILGARAGARATRGQCLTCGYDLRGAIGPLAKCPECGTPV